MLFRSNLHLKVLYGENDHHKLEAMFKALSLIHISMPVSSAAETARTLSAISRPMPSPGIRTAFRKILSPFPVLLTIYIIVTGLGVVVNAHFYTFRGNLLTSLII